MSRVGERRIPLFTRDQQEDVPRYLVHLTRELRAILGEIRTAINDNDTQADAIKMRRWFMDGY